MPNEDIMNQCGTQRKIKSTAQVTAGYRYITPTVKMDFSNRHLIDQTRTSDRSLPAMHWEMTENLQRIAEADSMLRFFMSSPNAA
jgi:hypothetical protein